jgi:rare lipoprotein A
MASLSYADQRVSRAAEAFSAFDGRLSSDDVIRSWKRLNPQAAQDPSGQGSGYVAVGTFATEREARRAADALSGSGRIDIQPSRHDGGDWYSVNLYPDGHGDLDALLQAAWSTGAADALAVRD